ncbi:MAG: prepilin-type N-terminal cleavage/methylation domain-containing protein, partial [Aestuariibacter sp.]|nr:prepilin-type N-terminal cleavage/methylation domain-containing protein [Aestuariibacter sp.]
MLDNRQSGMGLIEALIALLIISIGLLGIAALQITSL